MQSRVVPGPGETTPDDAISKAVAAVLPALLAPGAETHYAALMATLAGVFVSGLAWTWVATWLALRGELLKALRNE